MAEVNKDFVLKKMRELQYKFFTVKDSDNKSILADQQDNELSAEKAHAELSELLNELTGSFVYVSLKGKNKAKLGEGGDTRGLDYKVKLDNAQGAINGVGNNQSIALMQQIAGLEAKIIQQAADHRYQNLERQMKELKEDKGNSNPAMEKIVMMLAPHFLPQAAGAAAAAPVVLAGPPAVDGKRGQIKGAIERLAAVDPDFANTLAALADFAENKPDMYASYIPMLKNM